MEANLKPGGFPSEIYADSAGNFWVSDTGGQEIWQIHPSNNTYTIFSGSFDPNDAHPDNQGNIWFTDIANNNLNKLEISTGKLSKWSLPAEGSGWGVTIDDGKIVWISSFDSPHVYSFDQPGNYFCDFTLGDDGGSFYLVDQGNAIWLGDWVSEQIIQLDTTNDSLTSWQLPFGALPLGLTIDYTGRLWWADSELNSINTFSSNTEISSYTTPLQTMEFTPTMITAREGWIWFTDHTDGRFGSMDPSKASGTVTNIVPQTSLASKSCSSIDSLGDETLVSSTGTLTWTQGSYTTTLSNGWTFFQLPEGGQPWGILTTEADIWIVDQGRSKLSQVNVRTCFRLNTGHSGIGSDPVPFPPNSTGCSPGLYKEDEQIFLTANPATGWRIDSWSGTDDDTSTDSVNTVTMPASDHSIDIHYVKLPGLYLPVILRLGPER